MILPSAGCHSDALRYWSVAIPDRTGIDDFNPRQSLQWCGKEWELKDTKLLILTFSLMKINV